MTNKRFYLEDLKPGFAYSNNSQSEWVAVILSEEVVYFSDIMKYVSGMSMSQILMGLTNGALYALD